jgi:hypothetical protein
MKLLSQFLYNQVRVSLLHVHLYGYGRNCSNISVRFFLCKLCVMYDVGMQMVMTKCIFMSKYVTIVLGTLLPPLPVSNLPAYFSYRSLH